MELTEMAGFAGAVLAGSAYLPQISHLVRARCSAGISRLAFAIWLLSSVLVFAHAVAIGAGVFIFLGAIQIAAIAVIIVYTTLYAGSYCESHLPAARQATHRLPGAQPRFDPSARRPRTQRCRLRKEKQCLTATS